MVNVEKQKSPLLFTGFFTFKNILAIFTIKANKSLNLIKLNSPLLVVFYNMNWARI